MLPLDIGTSSVAFGPGFSSHTVSADFRASGVLRHERAQPGTLRPLLAALQLYGADALQQQRATGHGPGLCRPHSRSKRGAEPDRRRCLTGRVDWRCLIAANVVSS